MVNNPLHIRGCGMAMDYYIPFSTRHDQTPLLADTLAEFRDELKGVIVTYHEQLCTSSLLHDACSHDWTSDQPLFDVRLRCLDTLLAANNIFVNYVCNVTAIHREYLGVRPIRAYSIKLCLVYVEMEFYRVLFVFITFEPHCDHCLISECRLFVGRLGALIWN